LTCREKIKAYHLLFVLLVTVAALFGDDIAFAMAPECGYVVEPKKIKTQAPP
jgi:hypothetical protein